MPDEPNATDGETISLSEHQKLQRKFDRLQKTTKHNTEQVEGLKAGQSRTEALLESLIRLQPVDDEAKSTVDSLLSGNSTRRNEDDTSGKVTARLNDLLDGADADWDEGRFDEARKVYNEINEGGDFGRVHELERLVGEAITPKDSRTFEERVAEEVQRVLHDEHSEASRVDTGQSTARTGQITRQDLARIDPREGIAAIKEKTKAALDQLGI